MPPKRAAGSSSTDSVATSKKFRSAIDKGVDEFLCPITQELPVDPVTARDGHVYERSAIKQWLERSDKSPVTNLKMGSELLDATQVRSMLETMVKSGAISGDKADKWQERLKAEEQAKELRRKAEAGDTAAMCNLGMKYTRGDGVPQDDTQAEMWYKRSAQHGSYRGLTNYGSDLRGVDMWLHWMEAATRGDPYACVNVAGLYARGVSGQIAKDKELAKRWFLKALACKKKEDGDGEKPDEQDKAEANAWLDANTEVAAPWFDAPDRQVA